MTTRSSALFLSKTVGVVALTYLFFSVGGAYGEENIEVDQRQELFESRKYKRLCKRHNKPGKVSQTQRAEAGLEPKVLCRIPPSYPDACEGNASSRETVKLIYDVTPEGFVHNVRLVEATNECFTMSAAKSVYLYRYETSEEGGRNIEASVTFNLAR